MQTKYESNNAAVYHLAEGKQQTIDRIELNQKDAVIENKELFGEICHVYEGKVKIVYKDGEAEKEAILSEGDSISNFGQNIMKISSNSDVPAKIISVSRIIPEKTKTALFVETKKTENKPSFIRRKADRAKFETPETGETVFEMIGRGDDAGNSDDLSVALAVFPAGIGNRSPEHRHPVAGECAAINNLPYEESYIILQGEGEMRLGDTEPFKVKAGDVVIIPPGENHQVINQSNEVDLLVDAGSQPGFHYLAKLDPKPRANASLKSK